MKKRFKLSDELFTDLVKMTYKLNMDWFYYKYQSRNTIDRQDVEDIKYSWECSWFKDNKPELLTDRIKELFAKVGGE